MSLSAEYLQIIERGQDDINRRRAEYCYMQKGSRRSAYTPQFPEITPPTPEPETIQEDPKSLYPKTVTFYTLMGVEAAKRASGTGGAWRLFTLAKALDGHGREAVGRISADDLRDFVRSLGVTSRTWRRWYRQAVEIGLLDPVQNKSGAWALILPSAGKAAHYMGADDIGRKVEMSAADLIGKGWKSRVWAGYEAARGLQISREKMQKITGVAASTQCYRDNKAGVKRQANYAQSDYKADSLLMLKELSKHKGLFVANNKRVYWRLPDTRTTDIATDAGKGRSRKATAQLRDLQQDQNGAFIEQRALSGDLASEFVRLFCHTPAQRKASARKVSRQDNLRVTEIYQAVYTNERTGAGIFDTYGGAK